MSEQTNVESSPQPQPRNCRGRGRGRAAVAVILLLLMGGLAGGLLSRAFAQDYGWHRFGVMHGPMSQAQINDRIDRMTKHMAIELDATADQQAQRRRRLAVGPLCAPSVHRCLFSLDLVDARRSVSLIVDDQP